MAMAAISLADLNHTDRAGFVAALGHLFEKTPAIVAQAWDEQRPFPTLETLYSALIETMNALDYEAKLALIRAHPDLAGRAAIAGELTAESAREQASARLDQLSPAEFERFHQLNNSYHQRFGFPFIICVREQTKASILSEFERRLANQHDQEINTALIEIGKIARLRLFDSVTED
ncbi:MAG: 2-oxo-4-hydroxy-4-carboxy-5-ureidoimidazoline decarboxylase [Roseiflexaceae bacterium]